MKHWLFLFISLVQIASVQAQPAFPPLDIMFLGPTDGGQTMVGVEGDRFFNKLYPRAAAAMTGIPRGSQTREASLKVTRQFFRQAVLEFTVEEQAVIRRVVAQLDSQFGDQYPLLIRRPWKFIKSRADLCGGFAFTRGAAIVISQPMLKGIARASTDPTAQRRAESLLLHEQIHVLQRERPALFAELYRTVCGFRPSPVVVSPWVKQRQVPNPDGLDDNWVFDLVRDGKTQTYWIGTILPGDKPLHRMGHDFDTIAVEVVLTDGKYVMPNVAGDNDTTSGPERISLSEFHGLTHSLPLPPSYDHVNEVGAYLFTSITHNSPARPELLSESAARVFTTSKSWFAKHLNAPVNSAKENHP